MFQAKPSAQPVLTWLLIIGGALVVLAFYLGFVVLDHSTRQTSGEATTVALIATQIATLQPTPLAPTPFATITPSPLPQPRSCAMVKEQQPAAEDGHFTFYLEGQTAVTLYCHDMAGNPREFLTLPASEIGGNYSLISYPEGAIITRYNKVRLDPNTLIIDQTDMTFAVPVESLPGFTPLIGEALGSYIVTVSDFATATGCNRGEENAPLGRANIDLSETPFVLTAEIAFMTTGGEVVETSSQVSEDGKIANLAVNGRCGIIRPAGPLTLEFHQP